VCVGGDGELAAELHGQAQQPSRRIEAFGPGVDLDGGAGLGAGYFFVPATAAAIRD
jgi:hypothetical protein